MTEKEIWDNSKAVIDWSLTNWEHSLIILGVLVACFIVLKLWHNSTLPKSAYTKSKGDCKKCKNTKCGVRKTVEANGLVITDCVSFK